MEGCNQLAFGWDEEQGKRLSVVGVEEEDSEFHQQQKQAPTKGKSRLFTCSSCGIEYKVSANKASKIRMRSIRNPDSKNFCSRECHVKHQRDIGIIADESIKCDYCDQCIRPHRLSEVRSRMSKNPNALKFCSQECNGRFNKANPSRFINQNQKSKSQRLYERLVANGFRCELTGIELKPDTMTFDHVIPVSMGGSDDISNIQIVHKIANRMKGTMSVDEFVMWCRMVVDTASKWDV